MLIYVIPLFYTQGLETGITSSPPGQHTFFFLIVRSKEEMWDKQANKYINDIVQRMNNRRKKMVIREDAGEQPHRKGFGGLG